MHIGLITPSFPPLVDGGVAIATGRLSRFLVQRGHRITVLTMPPDTAHLAAPEPLPESISMHYGLGNDPVQEPGAMESVFHWAHGQHQQHPFDVLLAYFVYPAGYVACLLGERLHVPVVCSCRGNDITKDMFITPQTIALVLKRSTRLIFVSPSLLHMAEALVACQHKATVVANAIDGTVFTPRFGARPAGPVVLGTSGVLRWKKGIDLLLPLIHRLSVPYPIRVCCAGYGLDDAITRQIATFVTQHGLHERLELTGPLPHPRMVEALQRMDIYLSTSYQEGMPNGILEAMACGLPVVATAADGTPEVVQDGTTGYLCAMGDLAQLYERCARLIEQPALRQQFGRAGRQRIEQAFRPEQEAAAVEAVLRQACAAW